MAIQLSCSCGREFRVRDELLGKKVKCPECGKAVRVEEMADEDDEFEEKPAKQKKGQKKSRKQEKSRSPYLWIGIGVGGVVVAGAVVLIVVLNRGGQVPEGQNPIGGKNTGGDPKARFQSVNNLRLMALSFHSYHDKNKRLPPACGEAIPEAPKLAGLSWRAHMLEFMNTDQNTVSLGEVYLNLQKPGAKPGVEWNRPDLVQLKLLPFASPVEGKTKEAWHTYYRAFVGNGAAFECNREIRISDFTDGTDKTILIVEAAEPIPWTKADELLYDPKKPLPKLGGLFPDGFYAAFMDGQVRFIPHSTDEKLIRAMITRNGGEAISNLPPPVDYEQMRRAAGY